MPGSESIAVRILDRWKLDLATSLIKPFLRRAGRGLFVFAASDHRHYVIFFGSLMCSQSHPIKSSRPWANAEVLSQHVAEKESRIVLEEIIKALIRCLVFAAIP
jgi:hypothetical protein